MSSAWVAPRMAFPSVKPSSSSTASWPTSSITGKQAGQLLSKMRCPAPWVASATMALVALRGSRQRLRGEVGAELRQLPGIRVMFPRQANSVFLQLPPTVAAACVPAAGASTPLLARRRALHVPWATTTPTSRRSLRTCARACREADRSG